MGEQRTYKDVNRREEVIKREIPIDNLKEAIEVDDNVIRDELRELLESYDIPLQYIDTVISFLKEQIKSEIKKEGLPCEDWLLKPLFKLYVRIAYLFYI